MHCKGAICPPDRRNPMLSPAFAGMGRPTPEPQPSLRNTAVASIERLAVEVERAASTDGVEDAQDVTELDLVERWQPAGRGSWGRWVDAADASTNWQLCSGADPIPGRMPPGGELPRVLVSQGVKCPKTR
jgi:hypothetical protein